jgi:hypothetical protein
LECRNRWHNGCWHNCNDNMHVTFLETPFGLWFNAKKISPSQTCLFTNVVRAFLYEAISLSKWLWSNLPYPTNHNTNMHNLYLAWSYLQFDQRCHNLLNTFGSNAIFIIPKSKSSTTTMQPLCKRKKMKLPKWIW